MHTLLWYFVCRDSQQKLVDPIWQTLRDCNCFTVVVSSCAEKAEHKGQMHGETKALRVPFRASDRIYPQAFSHLARVRHVQVDAGSSSQQKVLLVPISGICSSTAFSNLSCSCLSTVRWAFSPASVVEIRWITIDLSSLHCEGDTDRWSANMVTTIRCSGAPLPLSQNTLRQTTDTASHSL